MHLLFFFFKATATTEIYTLSLRDALPISVAKIKVTLDGKTWEVTEENLGKLPEGVRAHVKRVLGREHGRAVIGFAPSGHEIRLKALQIHPEDGHEARIIELHPGGTTIRRIIRKEGSAPAGSPTIRLRRLATESDGAVEQLRKEVEALKTAVKKLQGSKRKKDSN